MKKFFLSVIIFIICFVKLVAIPYDYIQEYTLENGLTVFVLEDTSTPLIRVEYTARAGFSNQTKQTSGFFKLYTRIFETVSPLKLEFAECNADSSRYVLTVVPSALENTLTTLAQNAFSLSFTDDVLKAKLAELKSEVSEEAASAGGFINAAIDSRVFAAAPWKHDSGVYPSLFNKTTVEQARNILRTISDRYYTPQNSALFISGNIDAKTILSLVGDTFGYYYSSYSVPYKTNSAQAGNAPSYKTKKFVLHSADISSDMTQVVIQYTGLNLEETELAAQMLNNDGSFFKYNLVNQPTLNIPGNEYINSAGAHKKESSRLIIQSLLQKPQGKNAASITSLDQAQLFIDTVLSGIKETNYLEFYAAQMMTVSNLQASNSSSTDFMTNLASYWALQPFDSFIEAVLEETNKSATAANLFSQEEKIASIEFQSIISKLEAEEPYIFVIINSADYKKNKAKYTAAGFEEINSSNAAWYNQSIFKNYEDPEIESAAKLAETNGTNKSLTFTKDFYAENINQIQTTTLSNGIPVVTKANENSSDISILISIRGGKLNSADNNGYEEVMITLLAWNIQKEITKKQQEAVILGSPVVDYNCAITSGTVSIECSPYDFSACCKAVADAIVYGDILPAQADRAVANAQYKKRLENGSVSRQMLAAVMKELYSKSAFQKIFDAKEEILTDTKYQKILEGYPALLDASRYSIIITGLVPENSKDLLEASMGILTQRNSKQNLLTVQSKLKNSSTKKTVKLTHTFLTDIPAEKAGPMPSKLIPTTKFLDPVMYVFTLPQAGSKENTLTVAVLKYLESLVQKQIDSNKKMEGATAQANEPYPNTDTITFTILNVENTKEADACWSAAVKELNDLLNGPAQAETLQELKDTWTKSFLAQTQTNTGTAQLLQKGFEFFPYEQKPDYYLQEYKNIQSTTRNDILEILKNIPQQPLLRFYAK
jgi:zinc protease